MSFGPPASTEPHTTSTGLVIPDFASTAADAATPRRCRTPGVHWSRHDAVDRPRRTVPRRSTRTRTSATSSSNGEDIAVVDFDDLTLAPFGYDLAGLLVTASMTYGRLAERPSPAACAPTASLSRPRSAAWPT